jgi:hypothetical protein
MEFCLLGCSNAWAEDGCDVYRDILVVAGDFISTVAV